MYITSKRRATIAATIYLPRCPPLLLPLCLPLPHHCANHYPQHCVRHYPITVSTITPPQCPPSPHQCPDLGLGRPPNETAMFLVLPLNHQDRASAPNVT